MYLKSLTLKGFKSFAQTASIEFAPGLSVIVGPNGSGKSNIVDAISWVLGSQSPTALRSQVMDDVIFAGNPGRPALGRAEVTLTFDNEDRRLPLELDEVAICRTLFRSGDSGYAINATPARLIDITELLSAAGVGRHRHVIVSQGHIDAVLRAKPAERRAILEEAAGVSAFRLRKEKALRRLEDTEANLARLGDQLNEMRRTLRPLEQQALVARRHGALAAELAAWQVHQLGVELIQLRQRRRDAAARRRDLADRRAGTLRQLSAVDGQIAEAEAQLSAAGHVALAEAAERLGRLEDLAQQVQRALSLHQQSYERRRQERLANDLAASLGDELTRIEAAIAELGDSETHLAAERERLNAASVMLEDEAAAQASDAAGSSDADPAAAAQLRGRLAAMRDIAETLEAEVADLTNKADQLDRRRGAAADQAQDVGQELAQRRSVEQAASAALEAAERNQAEAAAAEADARSAQAAAAAEHNRWRARTEALTQAMGDVRARSGMEILASRVGVLGALGDLVAVEEGWEVAFEAAAGDALAAAVLEAPAAARPALEALVRAKVTGAVLTAVAPTAVAPPFGEPLRPHVRGRSNGVDEVLDGLIGSVVVVPSWQEACDVLAAHPQATVVTPAGDCFSRSGWRVGVDRSGATGEALVESRQRLGEVERSLAEAERAVEEVSASATKASTAYAAALESRRVASRDLAEAERRVGAADRQVEAIVADATATGRRLTELRQRATEHRRLVDEAAGQLADLQLTIETATARAADQAAELQLREAELQAELRSLELRNSELTARRTVLSERRAEITARLAGHEVALASAEIDARRSATLGELAERMAASARGCRTGLKRLRACQSQAATAGRRAAARLAGDRRLRAALAASLEETNEELLGAQRSEDEVALRLETVLETLSSQHGCDEITATQTPQPDLPEGTSAVQRIQELERLLHGIGPVNPLAVSEYEATRERHDQLVSQIEDVRSARRDLSKLVASVEREILEVFSRCYQEVAASFESIFGVLFEGGGGQLCLTEPHDLLHSGVEIEARPAGKNLRRLALLSGGERSLAALAFLFAMFRSQNCPFYVLDEVDAALDDINLHRFLKLVEDFRSSVQLVLVTHQKPTMELADSLYGVTMRPGGTSVVIAERRQSAHQWSLATAGGLSAS